MIALALVKSVPVGATPLRVTREGLTREGLPHGLDPVNEPALEWALRWRETGLVAEVVAVTMGPASARTALQAALALGCDRAVHVCDDRLAGADVRQTIATLERAVRHLHARVALCGHESGDGSSGTVPAGLASALDWPLVTRAAALELAGDAVRVRRDTGAVEQLLEAPLPAVVSVVDGGLPPRRPTLKNTIAARTKPIETFTGAPVADVPTVTGPPEQVVAIRRTPERRADPLVLSATDGVAHITQLLRDRDLS
jgi:electron transfer flavoprotein beta subunit